MARDRRKPAIHRGWRTIFHCDANNPTDMIADLCNGEEEESSIGHNAKALNFPQKERNRGAFDGWDSPFFFPPPSKWRNSSDFRETNSTDGKFQIQYLLLSPSPRSCSRVTVSLWFSWNLNGVSRERRNIRRSKRSPLRAPSPPITVPIKGGGIEPPPFFLFSSFFLLRGWVDRCKGREERGSSTLRVCWRHF